MKNQFLLLITFVFLPVLLKAQMSPSVTLSTGAYPSANLDNGMGDVSTNYGDLSFNVPVSFKMSLEDGPGVQIFGVRSNMGFSEFQVSEWNEDHTFYRAGLTGYGIISKGKNTFMMNLGVNWLGDGQLSSSINPLVQGMFLYKRKVSEKFSYFTGATYSFVFGGGLPFPVLGFQTGNKNTSTFQVILPLVLSFKSPAVKPFGYGFHIRPDGNISFYQDNGQYGDELIMRSRAIKLGGFLSYRLSGFTFTLESNLLANRVISLSDLDNRGVFDDSLWSSDIENGLNVNLKLTYRFKSGSGQSGLTGMPGDF